MFSKCGLFICFILCMKAGSIKSNKVIVEDFELKEPLDEELSEDFDENEFLINGGMTFETNIFIV